MQRRAPLLSLSRSRALSARGEVALLLASLAHALWFRFIAPRAPVEQASTARGARNFVPKKVRLREEPYTLSPDALICVRTEKSMDLPQRPPTRPSRVCGSSAPAQKPKMRKAPGRAAADQAATTTVAAAVNSRAPTQLTHIALALRSETSPTFVLAWQRNRSANNGMLLPHHISPPILAPPCSCFASAYRIRLRQRCLIIATRPRPVCSESTVVPLSPLDRIPV